MAKALSMAAVLATFLLLPLLQNSQLADAQIGVCYGKSAANNLPPVQDVVKLYNQYCINEMRIYDSDENVLKAVQNSNIKLMIGVVNQDIISIGSDPSVAKQWVDKYAVPYASSIKYIAVGNEVPLNNPQAKFVEPAMQNIQKALNTCNLGGRIKVSTAISQDLLTCTFPPSNAEFTDITFMRPIVNFLVSNGSPLFLNILTEVNYNAPRNDIAYILFTLSNPYLTDPKTGLKYQNQYDAVMDATYTALDKIEAKISTTKQARNGRGTNVKSGEISITYEDGFGKKPPSNYYTNGGDDGILREYGETYYRNLIAHVKKGTPLRPKEEGEVFLFEMFDEDLKTGDPTERHLGLFTPNKTPKYNLTFS